MLKCSIPVTYTNVTAGSTPPVKHYRKFAQLSQADLNPPFPLAALGLNSFGASGGYGRERTCMQIMCREGDKNFCKQADPEFHSNDIDGKWWLCCACASLLPPVFAMQL